MLTVNRFSHIESKLKLKQSDGPSEVIVLKFWDLLFVHDKKNEGLKWTRICLGVEMDWGEKGL